MIKRDLTGLVFAVHLGDGTYGFGRVLRKQGRIYYIAAFDLIEEAVEDVMAYDMDKAKVIALGNFYEDFLTGNNPRWIHADYMYLPFVALPHYKILIDGQWYVENWQRTTMRHARGDEFEQLSYRSDFAPSVLEDFLKWYAGLIPKQCVFDELHPSQVYRTDVVKRYQVIE